MGDAVVAKRPGAVFSFSFREGALGGRVYAP